MEGDERREKEELGALINLKAYEKHTKLLKELASHLRDKKALGGEDQHRGALIKGLNYGVYKRPSSLKTDLDILKESYRFIRSEEDDLEESPSVVRMARKYYSRLFREYGIVDLSRYKDGKIGIRWRSAKEVYSGKGQFICGEGGCDERRGLESFEVPFGYNEAGERKQALVKVRVCPKHALQLNYKTSHKRKRQPRETGRSPSRHRRKEKHSGHSSSPLSSLTSSSDGRKPDSKEDAARESAGALHSNEEEVKQSSKGENKDLIDRMNEKLLFKDLFR